MWYAGVDWADSHHDIVVITEAGHQVASRRVAHTAEGLADLIAFLQGIAPLDQIACIIETNQGLLISTLLEAGCTIYPVNPKTIDRRRNASGAKTDTIDAYLLAKTGRSDLPDLRKLTPDSPLVQELKVLTRDQDSLVQSQTRVVNQLTACLKAYYPVALHLFSKLQQRSTLIFLQTYPTLEAARQASVEEITRVLKEAGHPTASKVAPKIRETLHQPQLHADAITTRTKSRLMLALVVQLLPLIEQIAAYDKEISDLFLTHADNEIFRSLPGAGKRIAPRLLAEWGDDRARYTGSASVQALAGTAPVAFQSGNYAKAHKRYACLKPLRNALYQFAWQSTKQETWALLYYKRKRTEGKSHSMAVRSLANVWVRIIYALWFEHKSYETATFEAAQHHHASRAA
ncbi:MAG: IS110 family transposase [Chloroflexota bacterium]|nr:IS110 family transposase [Chloroflexota bacterium]